MFDKKQFLPTRKEQEDNYREVLVKEIPTCPAQIWNYLYEPKDSFWCGYSWCCYHCPKAGKECKNNGCAIKNNKDYPYGCRCYPVTIEEAEETIKKVKRFWKDQPEKFNYIRCSEAMDEVAKKHKIVIEKLIKVC